jgi:hypothetical protein
MFLSFEKLRLEIFRDPLFRTNLNAVSSADFLTAAKKVHSEGSER